MYVISMCVYVFWRGGLKSQVVMFRVYILLCRILCSGRTNIDDAGDKTGTSRKSLSMPDLSGPQIYDSLIPLCIRGVT